MTGILNLAKDDATLIAESGYKTVIPASGYVARVEYERRTVSGLGISPAQESDIRIVEQMPREIVVVRERLPGVAAEAVAILQDDFLDLQPPETLLLVEREVAEAAAQYVERKCMPTCDGDDGCPRETRHPLASRMVWAADPVYEPKGGPQTQEVMLGTLHRAHVLIGYRELRRVGGVG